MDAGVSINNGGGFRFAPGLMPARIPSRSVFGGPFSVFGSFLVEAFMHTGLLFGHDPGLGLRHADAGQALDEGVGVEGEGLGLHGAQNSSWGGGLQAGVALSS